ncbi:MAG: 3,8-cyclase [Frankiales bacterium]|jgi:cyclic pyranopterin phosphate synthase|nr:3,8-cyclase [Frankiales bacterium]
MTEPARDRLGRPLHDLRVSVTDRCNFRCHYCMPREVFGPGFAFVPREQLLSFEEITRVVRLATELGVRKVRLTGGEPLLRRDLDQLVASIAAIDGVDDLAMTTNGALLAGHAHRLRKAGLRRITVSLDSVDPEVFTRMADTAVPLSQVLDGVAAATDAGFTGIKLNAVVQRGVNDGGILDLVDYARRNGHVMRFIEYMDVGNTNGWLLDQVVPARELRDVVHTRWPLVPVDPGYPGEVARRYRFADGAGEVGFVTSVTEPFCGSCSRARLTAVGELYTCLFAGAGSDVRALLRGGHDDDAVRDFLGQVWQQRSDRYSELRSAGTAGLHRVEMSYLGG